MNFLNHLATKSFIQGLLFRLVEVFQYISTLKSLQSRILGFRTADGIGVKSMIKDIFNRVKGKKCTGNRSIAGQRLSGHELANRQLKRFGINMLVLAASIALYYLGFFGSVDGPLHPFRIGLGLHGLGVTRTSLLYTLTGFLALSVIWNWLYNLFNRLSGRGFICINVDGWGGICGQRVTRVRHRDKNHPGNKWIFLCPKGHQHTTACFLPVRKGVWGHALWAVMLILVGGMAFSLT
jgi:hypothetical protein